MLEDLLRREQLEHPHSRIYFWRTSAGAEIDLVIERGSERFAIEVKSAQADKPRAIRALEAAANDVGAQRAFFVDMGKGRAPLRPNIERRGFAEALDWLPALERG